MGLITLNFAGPSGQNAVAGIGIAFSAGVFVSLNLLGAGGGRPQSAHIIQMTNAILSSVWFFSACVGGTYLNLLGPGITMCFGICTYAVYVGSLWYYETVGKTEFPLAAGAIIGIGAGAVFITSGYIQVAYSNEKNKGKFIAIQNTLQATGSIICSFIPVILNKDNVSRAGVPRAVYITFITLMLVVAVLALLTLDRPDGLNHSGGEEALPSHDRRSLTDEIKANLAVIKEWKLLLMLPAFLPAGSFLIYLGSVNAFQNNLRTRSLLSFVALIVQIPCGHMLHFILDSPRWSRRKRALIGLGFVAVPLCIAWVWEIIRTRDFNRNDSPQPVDWSERQFGPILVLFVLNWTASILWQYIVPWFVGALTNSPSKLSHYMGVQRGFLAAGEAICFGVDSINIPYVIFASIIFGFYAIGIAVLAYFSLYQITETNYCQEVDVGEVIPEGLSEKKI